MRDFRRSNTRYKADQFNFILRGPISPFVFEFFANQPPQFLYLMASKFMAQEVAKATIALQEFASSRQVKSGRTFGGCHCCQLTNDCFCVWHAHCK